MHNGETPFTLRRSSRIPAVMPLLVTSMDGTHFSEVCETMVVNAHGCAIKSRVKLDAGVPLHFHSRDGREATAQVVSCVAMGPDHQTWMLGARLDRPQNFWGLRNYPQDWTRTLSQTVMESPQLRSGGSPSVPQPALPSRAPEAVPHVSAEQVRKAIAESIRTLQAEVTAVKEKLARAESNRSRFDVSLSSIPAELEQQLEQRLKQDLGPKMLEEARQQSAQLLSKTQATIELRANEVREEFQKKSREELQVVEQRAHEISAHITQNVREQLRDGVGDLQRKLADGRNHLARLSDELLQSLQSSLHDEHNARLAHLEQLRAAVAVESSRLQEQVEQLNGRIRKLDESVSSLESGLDQRLGQMAADTVKRVRDEMEGISETMLKELTARSGQALESQLDEAAGNMKIVQKGIIASASDSLKAQSAEALRGFEHSMDALARESVERWQLKLADGLSAVLKSLGEQFQRE